MKRMTALVLACALLLCAAMPAAADGTEDTVQPRYMYLNGVDAQITISNSGNASCYGEIWATPGYPVSLQIRLLQLSNSSWNPVQEWEITGTGIVSGTRFRAVPSGYNYKVYVIGYVYDSNGNLLEYKYAEDTVYY